MAESVVALNLRGGNKVAFDARDKEILVEGPAGTGKTRTILELLNGLAHKYPGLRALIVRKHQVTLTTTCLVTLNNKVLRPDDGVVYFGGNKSEPAAYRYPNGSTIVVGGMDNPDKVLSSEYDIAYVNEATELTLEDWETLTTRVRPPGVLSAQRVIGDCNPSSERHWLNRRCNEGKMRRVKTRIQDNPAYYNEDGTPTTAGLSYEATLENLSGARRQRLKEGEWVGAENLIYPQFDPETHIRPLPANVQWTGRGAVGVDFGGHHLSAVVAITVDQQGYHWVREVWAEPTKNPEILKDKARAMKLRYRLSKGCADPMQDVLAHDLNFTVAKKGPYRKERIDTVTALLDAGALILDANGTGINELRDEFFDYHMETKETDTYIEDVVVRKEEDRIAALEYAESVIGQGYGLSFGAATPDAQPRRTQFLYGGQRQGV